MFHVSLIDFLFAVAFYFLLFLAGRAIYRRWHNRNERRQRRLEEAHHYWDERERRGL